MKQLWKFDHKEKKPVKLDVLAEVADVSISLCRLEGYDKVITLGKGEAFETEEECWVNELEKETSNERVLTVESLETSLKSMSWNIDHIKRWPT
jgi:hypothetical protein